MGESLMSDKEKLRDWQKPTAKQEVSNRSILRIQELSNELRDQLNEIPIFKDSNKGKTGSVTKVLFASRDYTHELENGADPKNYTRWYNFRLCDSYDFPEKVWEWLKYKDTQVERVERFRCLFDAAKEIDEHTQCRFEDFKKAVADTSDLNDRNAVDQLLIALATVPYRGVLPSTFENVFALKEGDHSFGVPCFRFLPTTKKDANEDYIFECIPYAGFLSADKSCEEPMPKMKFPGRLASKQDELKQLFDHFLLPFTRGVVVDVTEDITKDHTASPYWKDSSLKDSEGTTINDLTGIVVPAFDVWSGDKWLGGMAGWIVICLDPKVFTPTPERDAKEMAKAICAYSWIDFTHLVRTYVRRVREAHMRDLLEDYAGIPLNTVPTINTYFEKHIHEIIGWSKKSNVITDQSKYHLSKIDIPLDTDREPFQMDVAQLQDTFWSGYQGCSFETECPRRYDKRCAEVVDRKAGYCKSFPPGTRRLCKTFIEELKLIEAQRQVGKNSGVLASVHDYSKDIGAACTRMMDFNKHLARGRDVILDRMRRLAACPEPSPTVAKEVEKELAGLDGLRMDWFAGVRFTYAHMQTQTTGAIIGEPAECVALLESGTLRDIYELVRILVWLPLDYAGYKEIEKSLRVANSPLLNSPATWVSLFSYDIAPKEATNPFYESLGRRIASLILEENISESQFFSRFQIPDINSGTDLDQSVLWKSSGDAGSSRWRPVDRLLPLFVFSMRFAFQCAWGKTILAAPSKPEGIQLSASKPSERDYRIEIEFPSPASSDRNDIEDIPYFAEWLRQVDHYRDRTYPWQIGKANAYILDPTTNRIKIFINASI